MKNMTESCVGVSKETVVELDIFLVVHHRKRKQTLNFRTIVLVDEDELLMKDLSLSLSLKPLSNGPDISRNMHPTFVGSKNF